MIGGSLMMSSAVSQERPDGGLLRLMRTASLIAISVGAVGSAGLTLYAGRHNSSQILVVIFVLWVLSPFMALVWANVASKGWTALTRATLYISTLVLTLGTLAIYGYVALGHPRPKTAFAFLVVPPSSLLLIAIAVAVAVWVSGRLSRGVHGV